MSDQPTADDTTPAAPTHFMAMFWNADPLPHPELDILATDKRHASVAAAHRVKQSTLPDDKKAEVMDRIAAWDGTTSHSIQTPEGWVCLMSTEAFAPA